MVPLLEIHAQTSHLLRTHPSPLIAVFVGGTSGIGTHTVLALASAHAKNSTQPLLLFIVGRNKDAATRIIAECKELCPHGDFRFVQARDLSLLKDVDRVCEEIRRILDEREKVKGEKAWIDLLVMTQGVLTLSRNATKEGLDATYSLMYYSRMRFITQLLPLLVCSPLPSRVISILNPKLHSKLIPDDLSLRKHSILRYASSHSDACLSRGGDDGYVGEGGVSRWLKWTWKFGIGPVMKFWETEGEVCGERILWLASERWRPRGLGSDGDREGKGDGEDSLWGIELVEAVDGTPGGGMYNVGSVGERYPTPKMYKKYKEDGVAEVVWKHTMDAFKVIEEGGVFQG
ncbi:putative short-chain dehydrogenase reductase protein [Botrytis fragariae]|uniref:Putative short-chain dehydrogenase reductase protein n=1 Tax=Botrytis fragariae TaxID=1964551 RepID=A0A8H6AM45_9HELO|nr:putative short-chain dehydrogenase reductase protein [Botrytis fragariae]KAF5869997.1 putative short-chain dehydrogenase reductase protein [Botrytis fragariae]